MNRRYTALLLSVAIGYGAPVMAGGAPELESKESLWQRLLDCGLSRSTECRAQIEDSASRCEAIEPRALARILLEEWSLKPSDPRLRSPRLVFRPEIDEQELREKLGVTEATLVVLKVWVAANGSVRDAAVLHPAKLELLNARALDAIRRARFRPARDGDAYIEGEVETSFYLHVR